MRNTIAEHLLGLPRHVASVHAGSNRPVVVDDDGPVTGRELLGRASTAADLLTAVADVDGCAVPALMSTNADALALLMGGAVADRPLAPLGPRLTVPELAVMVRATGSPILLAERTFHATVMEVGVAAGVRVRPPFPPCRHRMSRWPPHAARWRSTYTPPGRPGQPSVFHSPCR